MSEQEPQIPIIQWQDEHQVTISLPEGDLVGSYYAAWEHRFLICSVDVYRFENRRQGIGRLLVETARDEAQRIGARIIWSVLTSREAVDLMTSVFGQDAVAIERLGEYQSAGRGFITGTSASLFYRMPEK